MKKYSVSKHFASREKAEAFDLIGDRVSFNEFFESICRSDEDEDY